MDAALIGILGTILGFTASYILEGRKRKWEREEQWRERERSDLENVADRYRRLIKMVCDIMDRGSLTTGAIVDAENFAAEPYTNPSLSNDDKLWKLDQEIIDESTHLTRLVADDDSSQEERNHQYKIVLKISKELQRHISALIKQTYK